MSSIFLQNIEHMHNQLVHRIVYLPVTRIVMSKEKTNKAICISLLMLLIPLYLAARDNAEWRSPTQADLGDDFGWRKENSDLYLTAKADFDGDGKEDEARLLVNDKENKMGLFVTLSSQKRGDPLLLDAIDLKQRIQAMGIEVAKPGTYKTACGKGYWTCEKGEPAVLRLKSPAINFFRYESGNSYFIWHNKTKKFKRIWMSD